ncbi:ABC transporter substrate-binding protein, partial [Chloroflexota bacterium]
CVPEFKYLTLRVVPEESTRVALLKTGEIDATTITPLSMPEIPKEGFTISPWGGGANGFIAFGGIAQPEDERYVEGYHNQDPWTDVRVREAMNIAIDREAINKALHLGTGIPITIAQVNPGWDKLEPIPYDPERAKQLLAEAGYPDGFSFNLMNSPFHPGVPMLPKSAEAVAGYWEEIGLTVNIIPMDWMAYNEKFKQIETAGDCYASRLLYLANTAVYDQYYRVNGRYNIFQAPELDILFDKLLAEPDLEKRNPIWGEINRYLRGNYVAVGLFIEPTIFASNSQKVGEWPENWTGYYHNFEYIRHAKPLNTWRLFTP